MASGRRSYGSGTVYEQRGKYYGALRHEGRRHYSPGFKSRREAEVWLAGKILEAEHGGFTHGGNIPLAQYLERWLEVACAPPRVRPQTHRSYAAHVSMITREIGTVRLNRLRGLDLDRMFTALDHDHAHHGPESWQTTESWTGQDAVE